MNGTKYGFAVSPLQDVNGQTTYIGTYTSGAGRFTGQIDDLRFYNRALIDKDIVALYGSY